MAEKKQKQKKQKSLRYFDYNLLFLIVFLLCFGLVMLYSTSSYVAFRDHDGNAMHFVESQLKAIGIGLIGMLFFTFVPYQFWMKFSLAGYIIGFGLCLAVNFLGAEAGGQSRWFVIGGVNFQPSEIGKAAIILFLATAIYKTPKQFESGKHVINIAIRVVPMFIAILVNNLSTAIIIAGIAFCMLFVATPKSRYYVITGGVVAALAWIVIMLAKSGAEGGYRLERIKIWLDPESYDKGYQTLQGLYAIGSGGLFGKGLGESMQKLGFIPEAQNDMIFSVICEELGLFGAVCVIIVFILVIWRMMVIANNAQDLFGAMLVVGVMAHLAIQVIMNIAVVTNTMPNTGVSLPFISYGGTSLCILLGEMGWVFSVARGIKIEE